MTGGSLWTYSSLVNDIMKLITASLEGFHLEYWLLSQNNLGHSFKKQVLT